MTTYTVGNDRELVENAKADPSAFAHIYEKYFESVFNYFWYRLYHDDDTASDLAQETFIKAFLSIRRYEERGCSYQTYLLRIAHNVLVSYVRKPRSVSLEAAGDPPDEVVVCAEDRYEAVRLWSAVQELGLNERDAILLKYRRGYSVRETAYILERSEDAVKSLLARARKKLAAHCSLGYMAEFRSRPAKKKVTPNTSSSV